MKIKNENCPVCGADALTEVHDHVYEFKHGRKKHVVKGLAHSVCGECGTSMFLPKQLDSNSSAVREYQEMLRDFISPAQILNLREIYNLTQVQANVIFGGGPTAFSKYERGITNPASGTARNMLAALKDPKFMISLAANNGVEIKNGAAMKPSNERFIDLLPGTLRRKIEQYAASVTLSLQDSCVALLEKGLDAVEMSVHSRIKTHHVMVVPTRVKTHIVDYQVQNFTVSERANNFEMIASAQLAPVIKKKPKEYSKC